MSFKKYNATIKMGNTTIAATKEKVATLHILGQKFEAIEKYQTPVPRVTLATWEKEKDLPNFTVLKEPPLYIGKTYLDPSIASIIVEKFIKTVNIPQKIKVEKEGIKWIFPKERFFEYEDSDEWWCRKFNIGKQGYGTITSEIEGFIRNVSWTIEFPYTVQFNIEFQEMPSSVEEQNASI